MAQLLINIDNDLKRRFKTACARDGQTMTDAIEDMMRRRVATETTEQPENASTELDII